jgi:hypothetical protein
MDDKARQRIAEIQERERVATPGAAGGHPMILSDLHARVAAGDAISAEAAGELLAALDRLTSAMAEMTARLEALADDVPEHPYRHPVHREMEG